MKILAFAGSNSSTSINKQLAVYAANLIENAEVQVLDLNDYEMPIYSAERNVENIPQQAHAFLKAIRESDAIVCSFAEHNGNFSSAFKNIFDWASRVNMKVFQDKPMLVMATSPGGRGGKSVLGIAQQCLPYYGADIVESFSLPLFGDNFKEGKITNVALDNELKEKLKTFRIAIKSNI
ncbi:MAG: NAD(P)H-dependent oxidoreductase [Capnocytophaga sp.]|nr:NAD(P)H-dependent oxidoreductase [Capnocytophaga sp.]